MREFNNYESVEFNNLAPWSVFFHADGIQRDIEVPASAKGFRLDFGTIKSEVLKRNVAFCGTDGYGDHAVFQIPDREAREALFLKDTDPLQITSDILEKTIKQKSKKALQEWLEKYFATSWEKRVLMTYYHSEINEEMKDSLPVWCYRLIEEWYYGDAAHKTDW